MGLTLMANHVSFAGPTQIRKVCGAPAVAVLARKSPISRARPSDFARMAHSAYVHAPPISIPIIVAALAAHVFLIGPWRGMAQHRPSISIRFRALDPVPSPHAAHTGLRPRPKARRNNRCATSLRCMIIRRTAIGPN